MVSCVGVFPDCTSCTGGGGGEEERRRSRRGAGEEGGEGGEEEEERARRGREKLGLSFHFIVLLSCICLSNVPKFKGESPTVEVERQNFRLRRQRPKNKAKKDIDKGLAGKN